MKKLKTILCISFALSTSQICQKENLSKYWWEELQKSKQHVSWPQHSCRIESPGIWIAFLFTLTIICKTNKNDTRTSLNQNCKFWKKINRHTILEHRWSKNLSNRSQGSKNITSFSRVNNSDCIVSMNANSHLCDL